MAESTVIHLFWIGFVVFATGLTMKTHRLHRRTEADEIVNPTDPRDLRRENVLMTVGGAVFLTPFLILLYLVIEI